MSLCVRLLLAILFFLPSAVFAKIPAPYYQDITCPPMPEVSDCRAVCPDGYTLSPTFTEGYFRESGFYQCVPLNARGASRYKTCMYRNPYCTPSKESNKAVLKYIEQTLEEKLLMDSESGFSTENDTYTKKIIKFITLDPSLLEEIESDEGKYERNSFYVFIANAYKVFVGAMLTSSYIFVAVGLGWFGSLALGAHVFRQELGSVVSPKLLLVRLMVLGTVLWLPLPHTASPTGDGKDVWQPVSFDIVRTAVSWGNEIADKTAWLMNMKFLETSLHHVYVSADGMIDALEKRADEIYNRLKEKEELLNVCIDAYGINNFDEISISEIPDPDISRLKKDVDALNTKGKFLTYFTYSYFSKAKCKEIETRYKQLVQEYNTVAMEYADADNLKGLALFKTGIEGILNDPESYLKSKDPSVRATAEVTIKMKKLGWISFPLVTMPIAKLVFTMSPDEILGIDFHEPNVLAKAIGILTLPPGNMVLNVVTQVAKEGSSIFFSLVGAVIGGMGGLNLPGGVLGAIAGSIIGKVSNILASGVVYATALFLSYILTIRILNMLPVLVFIGAFVIKFTAWCLDVIKTLVAVPFLFLHSFSTRNYHESYQGMRQVGIIMVYPVLLLGATLAAFFGMEVARFLIYDLGVKTVDALGVIKSEGGFLSSASWKFLTAPVLKGLFFWVSVITETLLAYKLTMNTPEWILTKARVRLEGGAEGITSSLVEGTLRKAIPV